MNAGRMLKASKASVEQTIITLGYVLRLYDNIIANGRKETINFLLITTYNFLGRIGCLSYCLFQ